VFGGRTQVQDPEVYKQLLAWYPKAEIVLTSTSGEIIDTHILDDGIVVTAIFFYHTKIKVVEESILKVEESYSIGQKLAKNLPGEGLVHVMTFSQGLNINGTQFVAGLQDYLPKNVPVTGGFAGDGTNFKKTAVGLNGSAQSNKIVLIGFYGSSIRIGYGSKGGWDPFGIDRIITKSKGNILYELDGKPALALYKEYLGEKAKDLPLSGLLFPLSLKMKTATGAEVDIVRSALGVDEATQSLTFAGDVPEGLSARLMKANDDRLIDGSIEAADRSVKKLNNSNAELAIFVSCVGRKLVLKERTEEELEEAKKIIGPQTRITGFYSYGEICPVPLSGEQSLFHNQTMTITILKEIE